MISLLLKKNNRIIIKRLVGFPGDNLKIENYLYVNGIKNDDFYIEDKTALSSEIILDSDEYFVIGDNRQNSIDSRSEKIGIISRQEIIGKIVIPKK